jgi:multiple sugar transport system ATP-binding protein
MAEVVLENLTKVYPNGVQAVRDLSLQVADGELVVLVGPSGCGKSTTLRLLAGLEKPTAGTIRIDGRDVHALPPHERDVALVFQRPALYPHLTVRRNLSFGLEMRQQVGWLARLAWRWLRPARYRQIRQQEKILAERVEDTARQIGLADLLERRPNQLSGGEQQRVALGRALVRQPGVFLLDEPLSQLDSRLRSQLRHELHLLQRRLQATMIYVTHDQAEAMTLADRVVVLDRGIVQQAGRPLTVYKQPANRFVAGFFGWPSMNFLDGRLVQVNGQLCFATPTWSLPLTPAKAAAWAPYAGKPVTLGVRPEDVTLPTGESTAAALTMRVALIEPLGSASWITFQRDECQITARLRNGVAGPGRDQPLALDQSQDLTNHSLMDHAYLFDTNTGLVLGQDRPSG